MTLEDTHLSSDALINVSTSCGKCLIDCDLCEVRTGMCPWCWPLHLQLPDRYLRYHLLSLLLQMTVILNGQDCSLVAGRHVDILFFFGEDVQLRRFPPTMVALFIFLFFDADLLLPLILGAL